MLHSTVTLILCFTFLGTISTQLLDGIYLSDGCECNPSNKKCQLTGPYTFSQKLSTLNVKYGSSQVGVGTLVNNQLDLYLNENLCKGLWNKKTRIAELQCQHHGNANCTTKLRCLSGSCLDDTISTVSSAPRKAFFSLLFMIGILIMFV